MSETERWGIFTIDTTRRPTIAEVRAWPADGAGSRFVCEALVPDAERIVAALRAQQAADPAPGPRDEQIERLRAALESGQKSLYRAIRTIDGVYDRPLPDWLAPRHQQMTEAHNEMCAALQAVPERPAASEA